MADTHVDIDLQKSSDVMSDLKYISKSCSLITEALQNGCDVLQLPNGDIFITEMKPVIFQYSWDADKSKLIRSPFNSPKAKSTKPRKPRAPGGGRKPSVKKVVELV